MAITVPENNKYNDAKFYTSPRCKSATIPFQGEMKMKHQKVGITKVDNGFSVSVGCKTYVFNDVKAMLKDLELYYNDIEKAYKKYGVNENE